jgi:hypothetical protein
MRMRVMMVACLALALTAGAWVSGCGVKGPPIAPELVRPESVADLHASAAVAGIQLTWHRPTQYVGGHTMRDLSGFVILRAEGNDQMVPLLEIPVTDQERLQIQREFTYLDGETAMGHSYRYTVIAETTDGYRSDPSNEVTFKRIKPPPPPNPENFKLPAPSPLPTNLP